MEIGQQSVLVYLNNDSISPYVSALLQAGVIAKTPPSYSVQLNMMSKTYWFQNALQVFDDGQSLVWKIEIYPAAQGKLLFDHTVTLAAKSDPLRVGITGLYFDTDRQVFGVQVGGGAPQEFVCPNASVLLPRIASLDLVGMGYGGDPTTLIAVFGALNAGVQVSLGVNANAPHLLFTQESPPNDVYPTLAGIPWLPTAEGTNAYPGVIADGAGGPSYRLLSD